MSTTSVKRALADRSLGRQLALAALATALIVALVVGGLVAALGRGAATRELDQRAESIRAVATGSDGLPQARRVARGLDATVAVEGASKAPAATPDGVRAYRFPFGKGRGKRSQRLVISLAGDPLARATRTGAVTGLIAGLVAGVLLLLLGRLWSRSATRPLDDLRKALVRAREGDYRPLQIRRGGPEFRAAADDFDALAEAVAERERRLESNAATDPLTKVGSRHRFHETLQIELERAERERGDMAVVKLDLDGFRELNEELGPATGDRVLRAVADALREALRTTDVLARLGADHFGLVLPGADPELALTVTDRAREAVSGALSNGPALRCSAGFACFPIDAGDTATLLHAADGAQAWAKREGGDRTRRYDPEHVVLTASEEQHAEVLELLRRERPIESVYQPIVALATGELAGYEGLSRFPGHPERTPLSWFPQAQRCGLGPELEARAARAILDHPARPPATFLTVNVSPSCLSSPEVQAVLPDDLTGLVIEITEQERVLDEAALKTALDDVRARGGRVAVDDAGAGYAGLRQVMDIRPDIIKLDRTLVADCHKDAAKGAMIESFVHFARRTGATVCAEGVENAEELRALADLDVTYGQGFVLARPARPWVTMKYEVTGPLLRRSLRSGLPRTSDHDLPGSDERGLEEVVERLAEITSLDGLTDGLGIVAAQLGGQDASLLRYLPDEGAVEAVSRHAWLRSGEQLTLASYATTAEVLNSRQVIQVLFSDGSAEIGELALLGTTRYRAMLLAPIVACGESLGVLQVFASQERLWSRSELNRVRILAYQLAPLIERLGREQPAPGTASETAVPV